MHESPHINTNRLISSPSEGPSSPKQITSILMARTNGYFLPKPEHFHSSSFIPFQLNRKGFVIRIWLHGRLPISMKGGIVENRYEVQLEVAGPAAIFARPDTGGTPTSYPVPTWSAAKGLFESIAFFADGAAWICPIKVEVCRRAGDPGGRLHFQRYTTNYGGPLRKASLLKKGAISGGSSMRLFATILRDVCYRIHGAVLGPRREGPINPRHYLQDLFNRRLKRGQCFRTPCLGWSEFTCSYWGPCRPGVTEVDTDLSLEIPSMLLGVWDSPSDGSYQPLFAQNVQIVKGVLQYRTPHNWTSAKDGR